MWTSGSVVAWLVELGIHPGGLVDVELIVAGGPGIGIPDMPDRVAVVVPRPGGGLFLESTFDQPEFTLLIRGPQGDPLAAEEMALAADALILHARTPAELVDGNYLLDVTRPGGRPTPVDQGRDGERTTYTTTYATQIDIGGGG